MPTAVLIPARDEGPRIAATVRAVRQILPDADVLVVDSGSRDDTAAQASAAGARVLSHRGTSYAGALRAGHRHLLGTSVVRVVQMDADGQHPAASAPLLLDSLGPQHHLVIGSRHGTASGGGLRRRLGNLALSWLVGGLTGVRLHDVTSGFWAFDRQALVALVRHLPADCADANVRVLALRLGLGPVEVPVVMATRTHGRSMHDGWRGLSNLVLSARRAVDAARLSLDPPEDA